MKWLLPLVTCVALLLAAVAVQSKSKTDVVFKSTTKTDAPARPGQASSEADAIARAMEIFLAEALDKARPCTASLTDSDLRALLDHERQRELLGSGDDAALLAIAGAVGSNSIVHVDVIQSQGKATVTLSTLDTRTAKATQRDQQTMPIDGNAVDTLAAFADKYAQSLASQMPACPPTPDRYQQQQLEQRAEQQQRTAHAAARVAAYASSIK
jgi:hypothetical protein